MFKHSEKIGWPQPLGKPPRVHNSSILLPLTLGKYFALFFKNPTLFFILSRTPKMMKFTCWLGKQSINQLEGETSKFQSGRVCISEIVPEETGHPSSRLVLIVYDYIPQIIPCMLLHPSRRSKLWFSIKTQAVSPRQMFRSFACLAGWEEDKVKRQKIAYLVKSWCIMTGLKEEKQKRWITRVKFSFKVSNLRHFRS